MYKNFDVAIIGTGLAGLTAALSLADTHEVLLVCKDELMMSSSSMAQAGIAAAVQDCDSIEKHYEDTLAAGAHLNDPIATHFMISNARESVDWLIGQGISFTRQNEHCHLIREVGHSERRVLHVDDRTGLSIQKPLIEQVLQHPRITVHEHHTAIKLLSAKKNRSACAGILLINNETAEQIQVNAKFTILATGGVSQIFHQTTTPSVSTGDGIALAWQMGCRISNLEFIQFHPTCMHYPMGDPFLITEMMRSEGAYLHLPSGERFMAAYDARMELAPRDILCRAIYTEMKKHDIPAVYLDISRKSPGFIKGRFPAIYEKCLERGIDITREAIPVAPAAHYTCGGVATNVHGQTDVARLYCIGEAACTGFHGANRLPSNSLLECIVMARGVARNIQSQEIAERMEANGEKLYGTPLTDRDRNGIQQATQELRRVMWSYVGIVRSFDSLDAAYRRVQLIAEETEHRYGHKLPERELVELRALLTTSKLIIECAGSRRESRGCHYNEDCAYTDSVPKPSVVSPFKLHAA